MKNHENKYIQGTDMSKFEHIPQISEYNHNYYKGFGNDLIYGESDDDTQTEWYLVNKNGAGLLTHVGSSHVDNEILYK